MPAKSVKKVGKITFNTSFTHNAGLEKYTSNKATSTILNAKLSFGDAHLSVMKICNRKMSSLHNVIDTLFQMRD